MSLSRRFRQSGWLIAPSTFAAVALVAGAVGYDLPRSGRAQGTSSLPECQHDMGVYIDSSGDTLLNPGTGQLSLPGPVTNVPEFHDCQKLVILQDSDTIYGALFAVFGAWDLGARGDSLWRRPVERDTARVIPVDSVAGALAGTRSLIGTTIGRVNLDAALSTTGGRGWALVEIYAEGNYAPLGIARGFNCAYFYVAYGQTRAKMVNFGSQEGDCSRPIDPTRVRGMVLEVKSSTSAMFVGASGSPHYPAVARWDWDSRNGIQYFGVRCGVAWCEVGPRGFVPSQNPAAPSSAPPGPPAAPSWWRRVHEVKGWFDEQQLAPPDVVNPSQPAVVRGRAFPDPNLDALHKPDFADQWRKAAWVSLGAPEVGYAQKLNLTPATGTDWTGMTLVELCWGTYRSCRGFPWYRGWLTSGPACGPDPGDPHELAEDKGRWWARITTAAGNTRYYCVRRRDHARELATIPAGASTNVPANYRIPLRGTVRWRWRAADETIWMACDQGCCEVEVPW